MRLLENLVKLTVLFGELPISKLETHKSQPPILSYRLVRINPEHQVYALAYMARLLGICLWTRQQLDLEFFWFSLRVLVSDHPTKASQPDFTSFWWVLFFVNSDGPQCDAICASWNAYVIDVILCRFDLQGWHCHGSLP